MSTVALCTSQVADMTMALGTESFDQALDNLGLQTLSLTTQSESYYEPDSRGESRNNSKQPLLAVTVVEHDINVPSRSIRKEKFGTLNELVDTVLKSNLTAARADDVPTSAHASFQLVRKFGRDWNISTQAVDNCIRLAQGNRNFPVMLLLNPRLSQDSSWEEMISDCWTLDFLRGKFAGIGLELDDVPILDICPLLSDEWMGQNPEKAFEAREAAFELTQQMMSLLKPDIIFVCQCTSSKWYPRHPIAVELRSSMLAAKEEIVHVANLEDFSTHLVWGFHPGRIYHSRRRGEMKVAHSEEETLTGLLRKVYGPCASWRSDTVRRLEADWNEACPAWKNHEALLEQKQIAVIRNEDEIAIMESVLRQKKEDLAKLVESVREEDGEMQKARQRCIDLNEQMNSLRI